MAHAETASTLSLNRWQVAVSPSHCSLQRLFPAPHEALLTLQTVPGSDLNQLAIVAQLASQPPMGQLFPASIILRDKDGRFEGQATSSAMPAAASTLIAIKGMHDMFLNALAAAQALTLKFKASSIGPLSLGNSAKAVAAFKGCITDQLVAWGADPAQFDPGGAEPVAVKDRDHWISNERLLSMRFSGDRLQAWFRVSVADDGSIAACTRIEGEGSQDSVERIACGAVIGKVLFRPAHDADGKPVVGVATFPVDLYRQR